MTVKVLQKGNYHIRLTAGWCKMKRMPHCRFGGKAECNCSSLLVLGGYEGKKLLKDPDIQVCEAMRREAQGPGAVFI